MDRTGPKVRGWLAWALLAVLLIIVDGCGMTTDQPPVNVLFILSDDQGWNQVGYHGSTYYETPHIDRIAAEGVYFTDAYSASPICSPARASILTGFNPARLHLTDFIPGGLYPYAPLSGPPMQPFLPADVALLPERLREHGYVTGHFGKWHLAPGGHGHYDDPGRFFDPQYRGFDEVLINKKPEEGADPHSDAHHADDITRQALAFLERNRDRPFFLYVSHHVVHRPLIERPELVAKYEAKPGNERPENNAVMGAMIERMDHGIGLLLDKLDELGLTENTVVVFFSDNGGLELLQSQAPLRGGKAMLFEGGIRVPLAIRWPGVVRPGSVLTEPVISDDFAPTILEIAGVRTNDLDMDGVSLLPLLSGRGGLDRDALFWHYPHYHHLGLKPSAAIRQGDYKLIEWFEQMHWNHPDQVSLFNVRTDVGEAEDLAAQMPDLAAEMRRNLHLWRRSIGAQEMARNPFFDPERADHRIGGT
jgi:arylsulfatase A